MEGIEELKCLHANTSRIDELGIFLKVQFALLWPSKSVTIEIFFL